MLTIDIDRVYQVSLLLHKNLSLNSLDITFQLDRNYFQLINFLLNLAGILPQNYGTLHWL